MTTFPLWPGNEPDPARLEAGDPRVVRNVTRPTLTAFGPADGGPAVIVVPGGGFHMLSIDTEGHELANSLAAQGITAYVLEYRLIPTPVDDMAFFSVLGPLMADLSNPVDLLELIEQFRPTFREDGLAALAWVRERHSTVAMVGFSAGGILTADLCGLAGEGPDLAGLIYTPFLTPPVAPEGAPPLFVLAADDDPFGTRGSHEVYATWRAAGHPVELHLFPRGGHGFGTVKTGQPVDGWPQLLLAWLASEGVGAA